MASRVPEIQKTDLDWFAEFLSEEESDIANGLAALAAAVQSGNEDRATLIRQQLHETYPWVQIPEQARP